MATATAMGDSLEHSLTERGLVVTEKYHITGCAGANPKARLFDAYGATGLPAYGSSVTLGTNVAYCRSIKVTPWGADEAEAACTWTPLDNTWTGVGNPASFSVGTSLESTESDFEASQRATPFASRTPLTVTYNSNSQPLRLPYFAQKSTFKYSLTASTDASAASRTYSGHRNSVTWKGLSPGTVLCTGIFSTSDDGGISYQNTYEFAYDPDDKFLQIGRWYNSKTGEFPSLTSGDVAANNGIKTVNMQGDVDFTPLPV